MKDPGMQQAQYATSWLWYGRLCTNAAYPDVAPDRCKRPCVVQTPWISNSSSKVWPVRKINLPCLQKSAFPSSVPRSHTPSKACDASSMTFTVGPFVDQYRDLNHVEPSDGKRTVSSYGSGLKNRPFMPILNASVEIGGKKLGRSWEGTQLFPL